MGRPVTLFTGQWADFSFDTMLQKAKAFGYDGVELACWGDHFEVTKADQAYCDTKRAALKAAGLQCHAISTHLVGQAVCDNIDARHAQLTLTEGRYHQVRRMFAAVGNHVQALHRSRIGGLTLGDLAPGQWRLLDQGDLRQLFGAEA